MTYFFTTELNGVKRSDTECYLDSVELCETPFNSVVNKKPSPVDNKRALIEVTLFCATFKKQYRLL
jgi:hypothetical protein